MNKRFFAVIAAAVGFALVFGLFGAILLLIKVETLAYVLFAAAAVSILSAATCVIIKYIGFLKNKR